MPAIDLPQSLLVELFSPPPAYQDLPSTLSHLDPGDPDWERQADEVLDGLKLEVEFDRHSRDMDVGADAIINARSRSDAAKVLAQPGEGWSSAVKRLRDETREAMLHDLRRILTPLMQPGQAPLRALLEDVPSQWMGCIGACGAFNLFLDIAARGWPAEGLQWFLHHAGPPSMHGDVGLVEAMEALSNQTLSKDHQFPASHIDAVVDWCKHSRHWNKTPEVGGVHLAHLLENPDTGLSRALEAHGAKLAWDNIRWPTAIRQARRIARDKPIDHGHVAGFLDTHLEQLVQLFPQNAKPDPTPPLGGKSGPSSNVRLDRPATLGVLVDIVQDPTQRQGMLAQMESLTLSQATPPGKSARRGARL